MDIICLSVRSILFGTTNEQDWVAKFAVGVVRFGVGRGGGFTGFARWGTHTVAVVAAAEVARGLVIVGAKSRARTVGVPAAASRASGARVWAHVVGRRRGLVPKPRRMESVGHRMAH